jgi:hypothetical protein
MPIKKSRLSQAAVGMHLDYLRQLQVDGLDVEIPEDWEENSRALKVVLAGPAENIVFESPTGGVHYAVLFRSVAERSGSALTDWGMSTRYDDQIVPESFYDRGPFCKLGGREYLQRGVLNGRIESNLVFSRGDMVEGLLLASGLALIPAEYGNGAVVPFQLSFWDQFGVETCFTGELSVLRQVRRENAGVRRSTGLCGPDLTGRPWEPSIEEQAQLRYLELLAQEKLAQQQRVPR